MKTSDKKQHWEKIYQTKEDQDVSWYQENPETSLLFFRQFAIPPNAKIIDIGGGNSRLAEHLLQAGYTNLTVLDISETSLNKTKEKLGSLADQVKWIVTDITTFQPEEQYDVWHDRAVFHFLTASEDIVAYKKLATKAIISGGHLMMATFSDKGPDKCSGLAVSKYSTDTLSALFEPAFSKKKCLNINHQTPFGTVQNFTYCCFIKK